MQTKNRDTDHQGLDPSRQLFGSLHQPHALFLRTQCGETTGTNRRYELSTNASDGSPIIHSNKTGQWFTLGWTDIIDMAIEAGIDNAGKK